MEIKSIITVPIDTIEYRQNYMANVYKVMINGKCYGYMYEDIYLSKVWFDIFSPLAPDAPEFMGLHGSELGYYCHTIEEVKILYNNNLLCEL